jgi:hypothetical protein
MKHYRPLLLLAALFYVAGATAAPNLKDGMWEITGKMEMPGMPMAIPPTTHTQCLSSKDVVPQKLEKNQDCKITSLKTEGDSVSWSMQCRNKEAAMDSTGKVTYKSDSMNGSMTMNIKESAQGAMQVTYRMSGRRIGDCK